MLSSVPPAQLPLTHSLEGVSWGVAKEEGHHLAPADSCQVTSHVGQVMRASASYPGWRGSGTTSGTLFFCSGTSTPVGKGDQCGLHHDLGSKKCMQGEIVFLTLTQK